MDYELKEICGKYVAGTIDDEELIRWVDANRVDPKLSSSYQRRVVHWLEKCIGLEKVMDQNERCARFFEEATELVQSLGLSKGECYQLVDYVYGRPSGEPLQEIGGTLVTLAILSHVANLGMFTAGERELQRCWTNIEKIRNKDANKPKFSPLPGTSETVKVVWGNSNSIQLAEDPGETERDDRQLEFGRQHITGPNGVRYEYNITIYRGDDDVTFWGLSPQKVFQIAQTIVDLAGGTCYIPKQDSRA